MWTKDESSGENWNPKVGGETHTPMVGRVYKVGGVN